jgi:hypothetical protein
VYRRNGKVVTYGIAGGRGHCCFDFSQRRYHSRKLYGEVLGIPFKEESDSSALRN